jgi:sodium transport system ATP-binding protein
VIDVRHLAKAYGSVTAVSDISFVARNGTITGLLGPNGAGKTTTLRMISSLVKPDAGSVQLDGIDVNASPRAARNLLGVLPDDRGLYPRLTAREHIEYFGALYGLEASEVRRRTFELADLLQMTSLLERRVDGFSQGERTKVAIARALVHNPANVILDEATNGLDVVSTRAMREVIRSLAVAGAAVLFSSHIMQEVSALCDQIIVVSRGNVVARGTPQELLDQSDKSNLEEAFIHFTHSELAAP